MWVVLAWVKTQHHDVRVLCMDSRAVLFAEVLLGFLVHFYQFYHHPGENYKYDCFKMCQHMSSNKMQDLAWPAIDFNRAGILKIAGRGLALLALLFDNIFNNNNLQLYYLMDSFRSPLFWIYFLHRAHQFIMGMCVQIHNPMCLSRLH